MLIEKSAKKQTNKQQYCQHCISDVRILYSVTMQLEGICLEKVSEEKDLGVVVSNDLKVCNHCFQAYARLINCLEL